MLVRFVVSNFLSLKEDLEFNMLTGSFKSHKHHVYKAGKVEVLKAAAIYGANGAGKSNLVKAIGYLQEAVKAGTITSSINSKKFKLDPACQEKPVRFEIEFFTNECLYSYGLVIDNTAVIEEWLYEVGVTKKDKLIFERTVDESGKPKLTFAKEHQKTQKQRLLIELIRDNLLKESQLLLGKYEELKIGTVEQAYRWITVKGIQIILPSHDYSGVTTYYGRHTSVLSKYNDLLSALDIGRHSIHLEEIDLEKFNDRNYNADAIEKMLDSREFVTIHTEDGVLITFSRNNERVEAHKMTLLYQDSSMSFDLPDESDGTRRLIEYLPVMYFINEQPITYIFDEIDRSIHPSLLKKLLQKIMSDKSIRGQLIFTTHESNLLDLDIFRQDEIWFAEKERATGATQFYSLSEFKPRYDLDIKKGYLNGRFGAIPFLGDLENLNWNQHAEAE